MGRTAGGGLAADGQRQGVAAHLAVVVSDHSVDLITAVGNRGCRDGDGRLAGSGLNFLAVGVPADRIAAGVLAADFCVEDIGAAEQALALVADLHRHGGEDGGHIEVLLELRVRAGLAGHAVAPLDEDMPFGGHSRHTDGLACIGDAIAQRSLAGFVPGSQRAAAVLIDLIAGFIVDRLDRAAGALAGGFRAGGLNRRAGVRDIFQRADRNVVGIRAVVGGLAGVGAQIVQRSLEPGALQMDVTTGVIICFAIAVVPLEGLGGVQELEAQLLTHAEQSHVHIVDLGLIHVGIGRVIRRDGRDGVDDDVGVRVAFPDSLYQRGVVADEVSHFHAGIVGAEGDDHAAGLHHGDSLCDGVGIAVLLKGDDPFVQRHLRADSLLGAKLLQGDQAVVVEADGVGIAEKKSFVLIGLARVGRLGQQGGGGVVDLVMVGQIIAPRRSVCRHGVRIGDSWGLPFAPLEQGQGDADSQQSRQRAYDADQNRLPLQRSHGLLVRLCPRIHIIHLIVDSLSGQTFRSASARAAQLSA